MLQALYKYDKLHHKSQCRLSALNSVILTARRIVFAVADEGRAFQARAAATGKARSPSVERRVDGTISVDVEADRRLRRSFEMSE